MLHKGYKCRKTCWKASLVVRGKNHRLKMGRWSESWGNVKRSLLLGIKCKGQRVNFLRKKSSAVVTQKDLCVLQEARGCKLRKEDHHFAWENTRISPHQVLIQTTEGKSISLRKRTVSPWGCDATQVCLLVTPEILGLKYWKTVFNSMQIYHHAC